MSKSAAAASSAAEIGRSRKTHGLPRLTRRARRRFSSMSGPSTKPSSSGAGSQPNLQEEIAEHAEDEHEHDLDGGGVQRIHADAAEEQDGRVQQAIGHAQHLHPEADQRQVDDEQHEIADPHAADHAPEQRRLLGDEARARRHAEDLHRSHHQRHEGVRRDAERQHRDEGGLRAGIVGALRAGDALDGAAAEALGLAGDLLLERVGGEGGERRAAAGQHAEQRAEHRAAHRGRRGLPELLPRGPEPPDRRRRGAASRLFSRLTRMSATPNSPMAITTKPMPSASWGTPKVKRSVPEFTSEPMRPSSRPSTVTPIALSMAPFASTTAPTSPSAISAKYSGAWNCSPSRASGGEASAMNSVATEPAKKEPSAAIASAAPARPCKRHLVAVERGHHRGGLARKLDQDGGGRAAVLRAVIDAGEHDQRRDRREMVGQRQAASRSWREARCPGSTPISVPTSAPRRQNNRFVGVTATEKPSARFPNRSTISGPRAGC